MIVRIVPWWGSCRFVVEAHRFVVEVAEVGWVLVCFVELCCLALDR
jgi:hypothetical protein